MVSTGAGLEVLGWGGWGPETPRWVPGGPLGGHPHAVPPQSGRRWGGAGSLNVGLAALRLVGRPGLTSDKACVNRRPMGRAKSGVPSK